MLVRVSFYCFVGFPTDRYVLQALEWGDDGFREDYIPPQHFESPNFAWNRTARDGAALAYFGPAGSSVTLHEHTNAWNALVFGMKRWIMLPPYIQYVVVLDYVPRRYSIRTQCAAPSNSALWSSVPQPPCVRRVDARVACACAHVSMSVQKDKQVEIFSDLFYLT